MGVDMTTLLHQSLQKDKPGASDALAEAKEQVLASARGNAADTAPVGSENAPEPVEGARPEPVGEDAPDEVGGEASALGSDELLAAPHGHEAAQDAIVDDEAAEDAPDGGASGEPDGDAVPQTPDGADGPEARPRSEAPISVAASVVAESMDMDTQPEPGGTDRSVSGACADAVAAPPRRKGAPIKTNVKARAAAGDTRQVRGVAETTVRVARAAFPDLTIAGAINAYVAWKSGDVSGLSQAEAEAVRAKAHADPDPLVRVNNTLTALEKKMDKQASAIGELEIYTVFVMLDRLGFRPAGTMSTLSDIDLNVIKDVPTVMPKLSRQAEEIRRKVEQKKGRPQRNASLPSQDVI